MEKLIAALVAAGEHREALGLLAEAHSLKVARFCAGLVGSRAEGEELMQEAFIEAWQAMPRFRAESTPRSWLFGIARRLCIRHIRRRDRRASLGAQLAGDAERVARVNGSAAQAGEDSSSMLEDQALVREALAHLKPDLREAVLLRYQVGLDGLELAAALGLRPEAARKRVSLGLKALREALRPLLMAPPGPGETPSEGEPGAEQGPAPGRGEQAGDQEGSQAGSQAPRLRVVSD
ncbi:MAG: sigma-70 family RNA polymerase sigma factor [Polyangia bacterium]|jgi:RNA polymerase sigma-70 factor (ECF subfamily)|nr:sigma-70 family RNA polymerase sigma factor [Polyangia bacterium]